MQWCLSFDSLWCLRMCNLLHPRFIVLVLPRSKCRLRLLKLQRTQDFLKMVMPLASMAILRAFTQFHFSLCCSDRRKSLSVTRKCSSLRKSKTRYQAFDLQNTTYNWRKVNLPPLSYLLLLCEPMCNGKCKTLV